MDHQHWGIAVPLVKAELLLPVVESQLWRFSAIGHAMQLDPILNQGLTLVNVVGSEIGLVLEDQGVPVLNVVLVKIWSVADAIDPVYKGQIEKDLWPGTDHDQLSIWMVVLDGLGNGSGRYMFSKTSFQVEDGILIHK